MIVTNLHRPYVVLGFSKKDSEQLTVHGETLLIFIEAYKNEKDAWDRAQHEIDGGGYESVYVHKHLGMGWIQRSVSWSKMKEIEV